MRTITPDLKSFNIYCTSADKAIGRKPKNSLKKLLEEVKINSIFGHHQYISAGHVFDSHIVQRLLYKYPELLESEVIIIGLRKDFRDFLDVYDERKERRRLSKKDKEIAKLLQNHVSAIMEWDVRREQEIFRKSIVEVLDNENSIFLKNIPEKEKENINSLLNSINEIPTNEISRENFYQKALKYIPRFSNDFMEEVNNLYYLIGSKDLKLIPNYSPNYISYMKNVPVINSTENNTKILQELFKSFLIPYSVIEEINIQSLIRYRESNENVINNFQRKWWKVLKSNNETFESNKAAIKIIQDLAKKEISLSKNITNTANYISISSLCLSLASIIPSPIISVFSALISLGAYAISKENIQNKIIDTSFYAFCSNIRNYSLK